MINTAAPHYLQPYLRAAQQNGAAFGALLWASPKTQAARFDAICRIYDLTGKSILDVGCGRADFHDFLLARRGGGGTMPQEYIGLEAVEQLALAAEAKQSMKGRI